MANLIFNRILVLMLLLSSSLTPLASNIVAGTIKKSCTLNECCKSKKNLLLSTYESKNNGIDCIVLGCCDIDYKTTKEGNTEKTISTNQIKIIKSQCNNFLTTLTFSAVEDISLKRYLDLLNSPLPSFTTCQLLTVSQLC